MEIGQNNGEKVLDSGIEFLTFEILIRVALIAMYRPCPDQD